MTVIENEEARLANELLIERGEVRIRGSGGGGGGKGKGGGNAEDAENTLRSKARARMIEMLSEGEILGLVDGPRSIYFEQTPLMNADGTTNFKNVWWTEHKGLPDEGYFPGHAGVETPTSVEVQVKASTGAVQRTIVDQNVDAVRVIVRIPALFEQDKKKGNTNTASLSYVVQVRANAGQWQTAVTKDIRNEKCVSPYQIAHRIELPQNGAPWDIRVIRTSPDSTKVELQNDLWWEAYVTIVDGKFIYPNTAAIALEVNGEDMGQSVPARSFHVRGMKILVPSNYNVITRSYSGIWDGTFRRDWTNNPAWIFYDLITNDRYGLGEFIRAETIDKWSLYTIAQYCDQLVPSGYKNGDTGADIMEPRFTYNGVINSREEAYHVLQSITTSWRGMAYWSIGQVFGVADMPSDPVKIVAPANVINGEFNRSETGMKARHSVVIVKWSDPDDFYRPSTEIVINNDMLQRYGWREKSVTFEGCTSRGLAHRYGKWILDVEQNEFETIEYQASWDHVEVRPGDIVAVTDPSKALARAGGRIVSHDHANNKIVLDAPFERGQNESYNIMVALPAGGLEKRDISGWGENGEITVSAPFSTQLAPDAMYAISGTDLVPRQYRILSVREEEKNIFKVTGLFHDPQKYDRIERGIAFDPLPYTRPKNIAYPPENLKVKEIHYQIGGGQASRILFSWSPNPNFLSKSFRVRVITPFDGEINLGETEKNWIELNNILAGNYTFMVQSVSATGMTSQWVEMAYEATGPEGIPIPTVSNIRLADRDSSEFVGRDVRIVWDNNFASSSDPLADDGVRSNAPSLLYRNNTVKVYETVNNTLLRTQETTSANFTYTYEMNRADSEANGFTFPRRSLRFEITVSDTFGRTSVPDSRVFTNNPPEAIAASYVVNGDTIYLTFPQMADNDFAGYLVWQDTAPGFDPAVLAPIADTTDSHLVIPAAPLTTYYFRFAAYDLFGKEGINISPEIQIVTLTNGVDTEPPEVPSGLTLSSYIESVAGVVQRQVLVAEVGISNADDFAYFDFEIQQNTGNWVSFTSSTPRYEWDVLPEQTYTVRAWAVDALGNRSNGFDEASLTTPECPELAHLINEGSVGIDGSKIVIQGTTMLSDWRKAGDLTKIDGGSLSANTVTANKMTIGLRGISIDRLTFEHNSPAVNQVSWTAGVINYANDSGNTASAAIAAGNTDVWTSGTTYIYWTKGSPTLSFTSSLVTAFDSNNVVLASYRGGAALNADYGRTVIDGSILKTGTVIADQARIGSIDADAIKSDAVQAKHIAANQINAKHVVISDGTNLIKNWDFADVTADMMNSVWEFIGGSYTETTAGTARRFWPYSAGAQTNQYQLVMDKGDPIDTALMAMKTKDYTSVTGSEVLAWELQVRTNGPVSGGGLYLTIQWFDASKAEIGASDVLSNVSVPNAYGVVMTGKIAAPAGARFFKLQILDHTTNTAARYFIIDRVGVRRANAGSLIVDGSIKANHISVVSLDALSGNIGTITSGLLKSNNDKMFVDLNNRRILIAD